MGVIIDRFRKYKQAARNAQNELARKDEHIQGVERTVGDQTKHITDLIHKDEALTSELDKAKAAKAEATKMMDKAELKACSVDVKLGETTSIINALTAKVKALETEKAGESERTPKTCEEVYLGC